MNVKEINLWPIRNIILSQVQAEIAQKEFIFLELFTQFYDLWPPKRSPVRDRKLFVLFRLVDFNEKLCIFQELEPNHTWITILLLSFEGV